jgi:hypothetical protein
MDLFVNIPSTVSEKKSSATKSNTVTKFVWHHREDEERQMKGLMDEQLELIKKVIIQTQEAETDFQRKDFMIALGSQRLLSQLLTVLEKMLHGRPQASQGELVQLVGGLRGIQASTEANGHMTEVQMLVAIISAIERIGHLIFDYQIKSGIFKARCNIEEAINLGGECSVALSQEKSDVYDAGGVSNKAKPYAILLSKVVVFLERFMMEVLR